MQIKKRKLLILFLSSLSWLMLLSLIIFINPDQVGAIQSFFALIPITAYLTLSLTPIKTGKIILITFVITSFTVMRYFGIGNLLNLLLLIGVSVAIDYSDILQSNKSHENLRSKNKRHLKKPDSKNFLPTRRRHKQRH